MILKNCEGYVNSACCLKSVKEEVKQKKGNGNFLVSNTVQCQGDRMQSPIGTEIMELYQTKGYGRETEIACLKSTWKN